MIENRLIRLLISFILMIVFCFAIDSIAIKLNVSNDTILIGCSVSILGFIFQILCDVLNFEILNEGFFLLIKRIIFGVLCVLAIILSFTEASYTLKYLSYDTSKFGLMLCLMSVISASTLTFVYLIATTKDIDERLTHFFTPCAFIISFIVSLIFVLILKDIHKIYVFSNWYNGIASFLLVGYRVQIGGFCEDFGDGVGYYPSGSSYSNSSYSGSSYSGSSSTYSSDEDNRGDDSGGIFSLSEFESAMYGACRSVSWGDSMSGHYYVTFNVYPHVYISSCSFEFNVKVTKYDKYDRWDSSHIQSKIKDEQNKILNNARAEVKKLQAKYKNYDDVDISVQVNIDEAWD